jgi:hypothetical protein
MVDADVNQVSDNVAWHIQRPEATAGPLQSAVIRSAKLRAELTASLAETAEVLQRAASMIETQLVHDHLLPWGEDLVGKVEGTVHEVLTSLPELRRLARVYEQTLSVNQRY